MSYDSQCLALARHFLGNNIRATLIEQLSQHIQDEIETWIANEVERLTRDLVILGAVEPNKKGN